MRILIVSQYFWPEEFRINDLAEGLKDKGHQIVVLTGIPNYPGGHFFPGYGLFRKTTETYKGITVIRVPLVPRGTGGSFRLTVNYFSFVFFASIIGPFRCRGQFDVIFVYGPSPVTVGLAAIVLKAIKHAPLMFWVQDLWPESLSATGAIRSKRILAWIDRLVRFIYARCDRILIQSRSFAASIQQKNVAAEKLLYFPNSAEPLYCPVAVPDDAPERKLMPAGFKVMFAGNIGAAQDFDTILTAAYQLKHDRNIHWVILGDGRRRTWVEEQIKARGLNNQVHLLGRFPLETMPRFFALADVLLVTLRKEPIFALTIPGKIQSYLACAKAIVGALDGEGKQVLEEAGAGLAVPSGNADSLADAIRKMSQLSPEERQEMGRRGRTYFEQNFERNMLLTKLVGWLEEFGIRA